MLGGALSGRGFHVRWRSGGEASEEAGKMRFFYGINNLSCCCDACCTRIYGDRDVRTRSRRGRGEEGGKRRDFYALRRNVGL
ncbi:hypothetical protein BHE74_00010608 [Ensete ventricosum]|nr:hypothetical protein BHE74_00010608 [Ensete ventricosum]